MSYILASPTILTPFATIIIFKLLFIRVMMLLKIKTLTFNLPVSSKDQCNSSCQHIPSKKFGPRPRLLVLFTNQHYLVALGVSTVVNTNEITITFLLQNCHKPSSSLSLYNLYCQCRWVCNVVGNTIPHYLGMEWVIT